VTKLRGTLAIALAFGVGSTATVQADQGAAQRAECFNLHEKSQALRYDSKLIAARQTLRQCSNSSCPSLIAADCVRWLEEVERMVPSVAFEAAVDDKDVANVKVTEGDRTVAESITGTVVEFDPGVHKFKAQTPGKPPQEGTYVIREGEKNRVIRITWNSAQPKGGEPTGPRPVPSATYIFGSLAVAAAGGGAAMGYLALKKKSDLDALNCKPLCSDTQVKPAKTDALIADIGFGVAAASAGLATFFYFTRPVVPGKDSDEKQPAPGVKPEAIISPTTLGVQLGGSF
jgi:hypothetical protein